MCEIEKFSFSISYKPISLVTLILNLLWFLSCVCDFRTGKTCKKRKFYNNKKVLKFYNNKK